MNLKALITTLVLGSSSMASADPIKFSGSVSVSLGSATATAPRPAPSPLYRPAPSVPARPLVVVQDHDCHEPAPPPVYRPRPEPAQTAPVWQAPYYQITNTKITASGSSYLGLLKASKISSVYNRWDGHRWVRASKPTQAWFDLTEATRIDGKREVFKLGAEKGLFSKLQLKALGNGSSRIAEVAILYADGRTKSQVFKLNNTMLDRSNSTITLDLDGEYRSIKRIIVYGSTDAGSAYKIKAM